MLMSFKSKIMRSRAQSGKGIVAVGFLAMVCALVLTAVVVLGKQSSALSTDSDTTTAPGSVLVTQSEVNGPQGSVGCSGNQTALIQYGNHPANTSSVLISPEAQIEAKAMHVYCDNQGNLINETNGQIIPVPPPTPPTPLTPPTP